MDSMTLISDAVAAHVLRSIKDRNFRHLYKDLGLTPQDIDRIRSLPADQVPDLFNKSIQINLDRNRFSAVAQNALHQSEQEDLINNLIVAGASNDQMKEWYGLRSSELSQRSKALGVKRAKGRIKQSKEQDIKTILHSGLSKEPENYLKLHFVTNLTIKQIAQIWEKDHV